MTPPPLGKIPYFFLGFFFSPFPKTICTFCQKSVLNRIVTKSSLTLVCVCLQLITTSRDERKREGQGRSTNVLTNITFHVKNWDKRRWMTSKHLHYTQEIWIFRFSSVIFDEINCFLCWLNKIQQTKDACLNLVVNNNLGPMLLQLF